MLAVEGGGNAFDNGDLVSGFEALREGFTGLARGNTFGISNLVIWLVAVVALAYVLLAWTRTGAHCYHIGRCSGGAGWRRNG